MKGRVFFDMDGVLARWNQEATIEEVAARGYFTQCVPEPNAISAVKEMIRGGIEVCILSAVFNDNHSKEEKRDWLRKHLPEIKEENIFFSTYGMPKTIMDPREDDILVDDFSPNLLSWHGKGVKFLNGINATKGRWTGYVVSVKSDPKIIASTISAISMI